MTGKIIGGLIVVTALIAGIALYYLQIYAYYEEVPVNGTTDVQLTSLVSGSAEPILYSEFKAIDSDSSPIRFRACFQTEMSQAMLTETYEGLDAAEPRIAPEWFDCFDAEQIGNDLQNGTALAFMGERNVQYGIDRIVAIYPDGRGFAWHEINHCGEEVFDGNPVPADCPPKP